ncbi:MAG: hypothetical protein M3N52_05855, partial [Actinomycetota bacterium]|nr:hypothetical protein [Actinomycetota bacterium]
LDLVTGATQATQQRAESVVKALIKQGEIAADRMEAAVDDLLERSQSNRKAIAALVRAETERAVGRLGLARQSDIERLQAKIARLEAQRTAPPGGEGTAKKSAAAKKTSAAKKSAAAKKAAQSATAKKATGQTAAKKAADKSAPPGAPPPSPESPAS